MKSTTLPIELVEYNKLLVEVPIKSIILPIELEEYNKVLEEVPTILAD